MREWLIDSYRILENKSGAPKALPPGYGDAEAEQAIRFHAQIPGYAQTPLHSLPGLARALGVGGIYAKDESKRFSLNAFKGLGGSYAMFRIICEKLGLDPRETRLKDLTEGPYREQISRLIFVSCTDGNHGRGVSWAAGLFGCRAHIYMPFGTREARARAIREAGPARVEITNLSYDDTVRKARELSETKGWILIQDTSWEGYETIPSWIVQGYLTLAAEAARELDQRQIRPTHLFLQVGVGSMAGGLLAYFANHYRENKPLAVLVEPLVADCLYQSVRAGALRSVEGTPVTMMAGLNCGTPCTITWPILRDNAEFCVSGPDDMAALGMRSYGKGPEGDPPMISGESGASTLGAARKILEDPAFTEVKKAMGLDESSRLLFINTEGDTDPENYKSVVEG